jgi:hypothetical protein
LQSCNPVFEAQSCDPRNLSLIVRDEAEPG